jgi:hypothetical protein
VPAAVRHGGERWRFAGVTCKRVPGFGFECGLHLEIAGVIRNRSRGFGHGGIGRTSTIGQGRGEKRGR